jgi:hypothetical protein
MIVPANDYLDRREPWFRDAEAAGRVTYDPITRLVSIADGALITLREPARG